MKPNKQVIEELTAERKEYEDKNKKLYHFFTRNRKSLTLGQIDGMQFQLTGFTILINALTMRIRDLMMEVEDENNN